MTMKAAHAAAGTLWSIGVIHSDISVRREAPKQGAEGAPDVWLDVNPLVAAGLMGIKPGDELKLTIEPLHSGAPGGSWSVSKTKLKDGQPILVSQ